MNFSEVPPMGSLILRTVTREFEEQLENGLNLSPAEISYLKQRARTLTNWSGILSNSPLKLKKWVTEELLQLIEIRTSKERSSNALSAL